MRSHLSFQSLEVRFRAFFVVLLIAGLCIQCAPRAGAASDPLGMRIGGSVSSFEEKYGDPTNTPGESFTESRVYKSKSYPNLTIQAIDGYVWHVGFDAAVNQTWTPKKANKIALRFLPSDSECVDQPAAKNDEIVVTCESVALKAIMFAADYDRVGRAGEPGSISFTLSLDESNSDRVIAIDTRIGTGEAPVAKTQEPAAVADSSVYGSSAAEIAWLTAVGGDVELLGAASDTMSVLFENVSAYDLMDPVWLAKFAVVLGTWQFVYADSSARAVPPSYSQLNQEWLNVTWNLNEAASWYAVGIDNLDASSIEMGTYCLSAATDAMNIFTPHFVTALEAATGSSTI